MTRRKKEEKKRVEYRYYVIPEHEEVLALLGEDWVREYGEGLDRLHFHNYLEAGICHEGTGKVVIDDKILDFAPGNIMVIPPNVPHTTNVEKGTTAFWEWFYFDMENVVGKMFGGETELDRKSILNKIYSAPAFVTREEYPELAKIIELVVEEITAKKTMYRENITSLLRMFVVEILRMRELEEKRQNGREGLNLLAPAIEYVRSHYQEPIKMEEMAQAINISESHFRKVFLQYMNMRPSDYLNLVRVEAACEMMKKTDLSMEEVAYKCGFGNVSTLTRNFRKFLDITPHQWKKSSDNYECRLKEYNISAYKGW